MQTHFDLDSLDLAAPTALTIGVFDGVHIGHQQLIGQTVARAQRLGGPSVVLTFEPHPDTVLRPAQAQPALSEFADRQALIAALGVDHLVVLRFDAALSQLSAAVFMARVLDHLALRELWVGHDFRLGHRGAGTVAVLAALGAERGFAVTALPAALLAGVPVSSTLICQQLQAGDVVAAAAGLGRAFTVSGPVVKGDQRGRTIGFPTANVQPPAGVLLPADGVYACRVRLPDAAAWLPAVANIGVRPTFGVLGRTVEAHLLDWSGDLYDQRISIAFAERLRGEQRFAGVAALVAQIHLDAAQAAELLGGSLAG